MTPQLEAIINIMLAFLVVIPLLSLISLTYLIRLVKDTVYPPILLVLLTVEAIISFACSAYLAVLTVNTRAFHNENPIWLAPITILTVFAPMMMINVIALVLYRANGKAVKGGKKIGRRTGDRK